MEAAAAPAAAAGSRPSRVMTLPWAGHQELNLHANFTQQLGRATADSSAGDDSPLYEAVAAGSAGRVEDLLADGGEPETAALVLAAGAGLADCLEVVIGGWSQGWEAELDDVSDHMRLEHSACSNRGLSPNTMAENYRGWRSQVALVVHAGSDQQPVEVHTALTWACARRQPKCARLLLRAGALTDRRLPCGKTL